MALPFHLLVIVCMVKCYAGKDRQPEQAIPFSSHFPQLIKKRSIKKEVEAGYELEDARQYRWTVSGPLTFTDSETGRRHLMEGAFLVYLA